MKLDLDVLPGVHYTVENTENLSIGWAMWPTNGDTSTHTLTGLRSGHYTDKTWTVANSSIRLVNSGLESAWPTAFSDFKWDISNSDLIDPRAFGNSIMNFDDCSLYLFAASGNSTVTITNSSISTNVMASDNAHISLSNITKGPNYSETKIGSGQITNL